LFVVHLLSVVVVMVVSTAMVDDDVDVMNFFEKYSYDAFPSKHLKYLEIPAWDCRMSLEEDPLLHFSDREVTDDDAVALGRALELIKPVKLQRLYMTRCFIADNGCAALAKGVAACPNLEVFYMQQNKIGDGGLAAIAESCKQSALVEIVLTENRVTDKGVKALAKSIADGNSFPKLKYLYLDTNTGITDDGVVELAKVLHLLPELELVALQKCTIGDKGVLALAEAVRGGCFNKERKNNWVYVYEQKGSGFSDMAKAALRDACKGIAKAHVGWPPPQDDVDYEP